MLKTNDEYKELIGLAVSGATDDEIAEAGLMGGVTMCASTFLNAEQTDYERYREIVAYVRKRQQTSGVKPSARGARA